MTQTIKVLYCCYTGVYLTTVMTLTSTSVIMAVMVINLYNRGTKTSHPPMWLKKLVLHGIAKAFFLKFDIEKLAKSMKMVCPLFNSLCCLL